MLALNKNDIEAITTFFNSHEIAKCRLNSKHRPHYNYFLGRRVSYLRNIKSLISRISLTGPVSGEYLFALDKLVSLILSSLDCFPKEWKERADANKKTLRDNYFKVLITNDFKIFSSVSSNEMLSFFYGLRKRDKELGNKVLRRKVEEEIEEVKKQKEIDKVKKQTGLTWVNSICRKTALFKINFPKQEALCQSLIESSMEHLLHCINENLYKLSADFEDLRKEYLTFFSLKENHEKIVLALLSRVAEGSSETSKNMLYRRICVLVDLRRHIPNCNENLFSMWMCTGINLIEISLLFLADNCYESFGDRFHELFDLCYHNQHQAISFSSELSSRSDCVLRNFRSAIRCCSPETFDDNQALALFSRFRVMEEFCEKSKNIDCLKASKTNLLEEFSKSFYQSEEAFFVFFLSDNITSKFKMFLRKIFIASTCVNAREFERSFENSPWIKNLDEDSYDDFRLKFEFFIHIRSVQNTWIDDELRAFLKKILLKHFSSYLYNHQKDFFKKEGNFMITSDDAFDLLRNLPSSNSIPCIDLRLFPLLRKGENVIRKLLCCSKKMTIYHGKHFATDFVIRANENVLYNRTEQFNIDVPFSMILLARISGKVKNSFRSRPVGSSDKTIYYVPASVLKGFRNRTPCEVRAGEEHVLVQQASVILLRLSQNIRLNIQDVINCSFPQKNNSCKGESGYEKARWMINLATILSFIAQDLLLKDDFLIRIYKTEMEIVKRMFAVYMSDR
jgi:hypothetical protein